MSDYLEDLLTRMESQEWLPAREGEMRSSGTHSISFMAHREAEKVCDQSLVPQIEARLERNITKDRFRDLVYILAHVAANTQAQGAIDLFLCQFERKGLNNKDRTLLALCSEKCSIIQAREYIGIHLDTENGLVLSQSLQYFEKTKDASFLSKICDLLDSDCKGLCHPMYAVWALEGIGDPAAIPFLKRVVDRHAGTRKRDFRETRQYAKKALISLGYEYEWPFDRDTQNYFCHAIAVGNFAQAKVWLKVGANPNSKDSDRWSPLYTAVEYGREEIAQFLLDSGADPDSTDGQGRTALTNAILRGKYSMIEPLVMAGADAVKALHALKDTGIPNEAVAAVHSAAAKRQSPQ